MTKTIITYAITLIAFVAIDLVWLGWLARATYMAEMGDLLRKQPDLVAAVIFYLVYAAGHVLCYFTRFEIWLTYSNRRTSSSPRICCLWHL